MQLARLEIHIPANIFGENPGTYNRSDLCVSYFCYINNYHRQVYSRFYILSIQTDTCNLSSLRYMFGFIFKVEKKVPTIGQVLTISGL